MSDRAFIFLTPHIRKTCTLSAIEKATAALVASTYELLKRWPNRRKCIAGIGALINSRLQFYCFSRYWTVDCWEWKARLLRLFSTLPNANRTKTKKFGSDDIAQSSDFSPPIRRYQLSCGKSSLADLFFFRFAFLWVENNLKSLAFHIQQSTAQYREK